MTESPKQQRVLAIKLRQLGDTVLMTPALRVLKDLEPQAAIDVMVSAASAPLLAHLSFVTNVIAIKEPRGVLKRLDFWWQTIKVARARGYGRILVFHGSFKLALVAKLIALGHGVSVINHHALKPSFWQSITLWLLSKRTVPGRGVLKPNSDRDLDVLRALGHDVLSSHAARPLLAVTRQERETAAKRLADAGMRPSIKPVYLGIGASRKTKRWPPRKFVELMDLLTAGQVHAEAQFIICSIADDADWLAEFSKIIEEPAYQRLRSAVILFHDLGLREVLALIANSSVYVGNDSGMKHVAVALGRPTVTVFGPESPYEWHPYVREQNPFFYIEDLKCRTAGGTHWCAIPECVKEKHRCLNDITAMQVKEAVQKL